jgi:putative flippase GtrA
MRTSSPGQVTLWRRWSRFNGVGLVGVAVQIAVLGVLVDLLSVDFRIATPVAVAAAVAHNFVWHYRWTWADRAAAPGPLMLFVRFAAGNGVVSMFGNIALMELLVGSAGVAVIPANLIAIAACGLANYWWADRLVFRPSPEGLRERSRPG